jgi:hypothetical protein
MTTQVNPPPYRTIDSLKAILTLVKNNPRISDSEKAQQRAFHIDRYKLLNPSDTTVDAAVAGV